MAKRTSGSRSAYRPGGQGPTRAKKTADEAEPATDELVDDVAYSEVEVDETAVAALAAATPPKAEAEAEPKSKRSRRRDRRKSTKQRSDDLASRAAAENVWVREDLRRIGIVSVVLIVALAVCWVVFGMMDVLNLY